VIVWKNEFFVMIRLWRRLPKLNESIKKNVTKKRLFQSVYNFKTL